MTVWQVSLSPSCLISSVVMQDIHRQIHTRLFPTRGPLYGSDMPFETSTSLTETKSLALEANVGAVGISKDVELSSGRTNVMTQCQVSLEGLSSFEPTSLHEGFLWHSHPSDFSRVTRLDLEGERLEIVPYPIKSMDQEEMVDYLHTCSLDVSTCSANLQPRHHYPHS
jgi:hypothetical protein